MKDEGRGRRGEGGRGEGRKKGGWRREGGSGWGQEVGVGGEEGGRSLVMTAQHILFAWRILYESVLAQASTLTPHVCLWGACAAPCNSRCTATCPIGSTAGKPAPTHHREDSRCTATTHSHHREASQKSSKADVQRLHREATTGSKVKVPSAGRNQRSSAKAEDASGLMATWR